MRRLTLLGALVAALGSAPAYAKGPALTWEVDPQTPVAGQPTSIVLRTWEWTEDGEPDTTRPSRDGFVGQDVLDLPVRAYPASRFPHLGPAQMGIRVTRMVRVLPSVYRGTVTFPRPGNWVLAWRGYHPGDPDRLDKLLLEVRVGPSTMAEGAGAQTERSAADTGELPWVAAAAVGVVLAALALNRRPARTNKG